jgi:hypothetical protein
MTIKSFCDNCKQAVTDDTCTIVDAANLLLCLECNESFLLYALFCPKNDLFSQDV